MQYKIYVTYGALASSWYTLQISWLHYNKVLQKGAITGIWYKIAPINIIHSWVEIWYKDDWRSLEGVILDDSYLEQLKQKFSSCKGTFCGYGVYTDTFEKPPVEWDGGNTYIQSLGINQDFGLFDSPDDFYEQHGSNLNGIKCWIYEAVVRKIMNRNIERIRQNRS